MQSKKYLISAAILFCHILNGVAEVAFVSKSVHSPIKDSDINRYEIRFDSIGESGQAVIWDFSHMQKGESNTIRFKSLNNSQSKKYENERLSRFLLNEDTLLRTSYFDAGEKLDFILPEKRIVYPMVYGDSITDLFFAEGNFGKTNYLRNAGILTVVANATGTLISPDNDTIKNVIRVHSHKHAGILLTDSDFKLSFFATGDSSLLSSDNILHTVASDSITEIYDQWQWYSTNHPHPIIEKTQIQVLHYGVLVDFSENAYYTSPTHQEYIEPDNEEILIAEERTKQHNAASQKPRRVSNNGSSSSAYHSSGKQQISTIGNTVTFDIYPTIVNRSVSINCNGQPDHASISIINANGQTLQTFDLSNGCSFPFVIDMDEFQSGVYVVAIETVNEKFVQTIIKIKR